VTHRTSLALVQLKLSQQIHMLHVNFFTGEGFTMPYEVTLPAAQYLRISTGRQHCSLQNQIDTISAYARQHGFHIVKTYVDSGSGLTIKKRPQLRGLLQDIITGAAHFVAVLVYDVSRWGRFQDCDEAAHYEFICKQSGVCVHYCAEPFTNGSSISASVMKALKRSMAAEYSRELGNKCFAGAKRLAELGYKQGGAPGYGLRRMLVSADGIPKGLLRHGDIKSLRTDRVILVPGPTEEVEIVREIYRMVVEEHKSAYRIARDLQSLRVPPPTDHWRLTAVKRILTNPKYAGMNVWNRTTKRLGSKERRVEQELWVAVPRSFDPIINEQVFARTQALIAPVRNLYSREELLRMLRELLAREGKLSCRMIKTNALPPSHTFVRHFGSVGKAFELAGQPNRRSRPTEEATQKATAIRDNLLTELLLLFPGQVSRCSPQGLGPDFLVLDNQFRLAVAACPAVLRNARVQWHVEHSLLDGISCWLLARLTSNNSKIKDVFVVHSFSANWIYGRSELVHCHQLTDLSDFCRVVRQHCRSRNSPEVLDDERTKGHR
jgi:DNA invertase Pin-like site-specific DNA recombinase